MVRFDFKLSRKVDFKIHNFDPLKKRSVVEEKNGQKRMKGSNAAQGINIIGQDNNIIVTELFELGMWLQPEYCTIQISELSTNK